MKEGRKEIYKPTHFTIYELVPESLFKLNYPDEMFFTLFDNRILWTADGLRRRYGKMIVNTYNWGGKSHYRGWRPFDCEVGAKLSQHKFGRALDLIPTEITAEEIREDILKKQKGLELFKYITCIETNVSWLHFDCRNHNKQRFGLLIIKP